VLFCVGYFQDRVSQTMYMGPASNCNLPDLCS
jgi:hypothetical protein